MTQPLLSGRQPPHSEQTVRLVDCDVHPHLPGLWNEVLAPHFSPEWAVRFGVSQGSDEDSEPGYGGADQAHRSGVGYGLPFNSFYPLPGNPLRRDALGPNGEPAATDPDLSARQLLDDRGVDRVLLIPQTGIGNGALPNRDVAYEVASALNHYYYDNWLSRDHRWRGFVHVPAQDPQRAAAEIDRWADKPGIVGVYISPNNQLFGDAYFYPIYEAADHHRMALYTHITGTTGIFAMAPQAAGAPPAHHLEYRHSMVQPFQSYIVSLIANGVFERFPNVRFGFAEVGFAWLADLMWRLDSFWKASRKETPWVKRPPSEYIKEYVRVTTQPFIEPVRHAQIAQVLEMIHAERTLMFASDFPHWDAEDPVRVLDLIPEHFRSRVAAENAIELFGSRLID